MNRDAAWQAAREWCEAWNRRDLDAIMRHYADDVVLTSPMAVERGGFADGTLRGKAAVRAYFAVGLKRPGLRFELLDVLLGIGGMTIVYRRESGAMVADAMEWDAADKARRVQAFYGVASN